jgi:ribosomal protein L11 methyltransferase
MLDYLEVALKLDPFEPNNEVAVALLAEIGFESFLEENNTVKAYIPQATFNQIEFDAALGHFNDLGISIEATVYLIPAQNWNQLWEKDFSPVILPNLTILAPFHGDEFRKHRYIEIEPKMSFGTGHHDTTALMCNAMDEIDFQQKKVLDMGTGTGLLAILAEYQGAAQVTAVDVEAWAVENAKENAARNQCQKVMVRQGDIDCVQNGPFDVIVANINKNVLLNHLPEYDKLLEKKGMLLLSGFFSFDNEEMIQSATNCNFQIHKTYDKNNWSCLLFFKK